MKNRIISNVNLKNGRSSKSNEQGIHKHEERERERDGECGTGVWVRNS